MHRTERLLDLLALLVNARRPVTLDELREAFPDDYGADKGEAARRKLERDKADLLALGVPLVWRAPDEDDEEGGYLVDRARLFLPELSLGPDEMAVVYLAGLSLANDPRFPGAAALSTALGKMAVGSDVPERDSAPLRHQVVIDYAPAAGGEALGANLQALDGAIARRKRTRFVYRTRADGREATREVEPYGLFCRRGRWSLVGFDRARAAIRVFLVERMRELEVNLQKPGTPDFAPPEGFRLAEYARVPAWRYDAGEPVTVELEADPEFAWLAERELGAPAGEGAGGWPRFRLEATNLGALVEWVLGMGAKVRVTSPPEVRARVKATLEAVLRRSEAA